MACLNANAKPCTGGSEAQPKVGIVTYHHVNNYGSVLQAYATQEVLRSLGCDPYVIDYVNAVNRDEALLRTMVLDSGYADGPLLKKAAFYLANWPDVRNMTKVFAAFRDARLNLTERCYTVDDCARVANEGGFDAYCTGSDQVWNMHSSKASHGVDSVFFLSFAPGGTYRFSLSASVGVDTLTDEEEKAYCSLLSSYDAISVRELSSVDLLRGIGIGDVAHVVDPTLLLGPDAWRDFGRDAGLPDGYVLVYQLHDDARLLPFAQAAAQRLGVPVIRVSFFMRNRLKDRNVWYLPSPEQLVTAFDDASLIVTDSFHGTAFATQLNTPFVSFAPGSFSNRITEHLRSLGLQSRIYGEGCPVDSYLELSSWDKPNELLDCLRVESVVWINSAVKAIPTRRKL